ncbi:GNAT family N-acetyltransferase [Nocardia sp. NBC_00508]|uniref:GNAT family N-acetyltransferase n=1 Tax=Nocardia sp. NBC_00508 TaxID=2975992 RepID=UPI002E81CCFB|nr:GNAT family N-acetyltransferase [Nocardia sp. NBC_00508]WUD63885.1 GNAT family N-acetyltransferase [Nocardia sp. NBC_00508]
MTLPGITIRSATEDDTPAIETLVETSFGTRYDPAELDRVPLLFPEENSIVAEADGQIVGHVQSTTMTVTVPGERTVQACGIAGVGVAPTHRRRGILRAMYTEQHRRIEAADLPLTMFTASEGGIYGRFGYGTATRENAVTIDRRFAEFLPSAPDPGGVTLPAARDMRGAAESIYDRWRRLVPGAQVRPAASWDILFDDPQRFRDGGSDLFALLHADGYALYRFHSEGRARTVEVVEMRAVTKEAHAALWRALLGLDLVQRVAAVLTDHDPLPYLLTDPRLVRTTARYDGLWLRLMDIPAALAARAYAGDLDVALEVTDPFRNAGGTFELRVRDGQAVCEPTDRAADIELGIDILGSMYFGAYPARLFAAANRLRAKDSALLRAFDDAFRAERDAALGWFF